MSIHPERSEFHFALEVQRLEKLGILAQAGHCLGQRNGRHLGARTDLAVNAWMPAAQILLYIAIGAPHQVHQGLNGGIEGAVRPVIEVIAI